MRLIQKVSLLAATASLAVLASCASKESYSGKPEATTTDDDGPKVVQATPSVKSTESKSADLRGDSGNLLSERLVFFDFDKSFVREDHHALLAAHADFLTSNRNKAIVLQGHADERGSTEYNLALGQRRSDAVREFLVSFGVFPEQIEAISYGEERPRALGSNEGAWAENRRVEIIYTDE